MAKLVSKTYGDALFDLALEQNSVDALTKEVEALKEVLASNDELTKFINHPKVSKEEKIDVIEKSLKGSFSDTVVGFLVIVLQKGRFDEINAILNHYMDRYLDYKNIGVATVTSAITLNDEQKAKIEKKLLATTKYEEFQMTYTVDKSLIGGIMIRIGDRIVDNSIKNQIRSMTKALV
ncbi:MAG: ATP synthase F1 subunit delta [bacterium]|nr:ATP synthase F1 subunit delta [bacterium]